MKHTPGQIVVSDHPFINGIKALRNESGNLIAECTEANAARLALAWNCHQDLIEALQAAERWVGMYEGKEGHDAAARAMLETIRAALAKVGGGK